MDDLQTAPSPVNAELPPVPDIDEAEQNRVCTLVGHLMVALSETGCRKGLAWWCLYWSIRMVGLDPCSVMVAEAQRIHSMEGMITKDGVKRTLGGCFFQLVRAHLGRRGWNRLQRYSERSWSRRWHRKMREVGPLPTTEQGLKEALVALGDQPAQGIAWQRFVDLAIHQPFVEAKGDGFGGVAAEMERLSAKARAEVAMLAPVVATERPSRAPSKAPRSPAPPPAAKPAKSPHKLKGLPPIPVVEVYQARRRPTVGEG
jgi:hypothetical protein